MGKDNETVNLFRNEPLIVWEGGREIIAKMDQYFPIKKGSRIVIGPTKKTSGFPQGAGDLIGYTEVIITADMVGKPIAIFTSRTNKGEHDNLTKLKKNWHNKIIEAGGISEIWSVKKGEIHVEQNKIS